LGNLKKNNNLVVAWVPVAKEPVRLVRQDGRRPDNGRVIVVTDPPTHTQTHPHTDRTDYNTLRYS